MVVARVRKMVRMDDEMINEMLCHWSHVLQRPLPTGYFDGDRNLLLTDARVLHKAAIEEMNEEALSEATALLVRYRCNKST